MELCIRIWDNILVFGITFIFNVSLAILKSCERELLKMECIEIKEFFDDLKWSYTDEGN
jgi:hypothetical protein